ncbi:S41 family peptidase [Pedobacter sp.]|uniref:S41 family peptidase n=1 Tax=Pedobacter sp. TaxID=1411316 RepID=UPI0031DD448C
MKRLITILILSIPLISFAQQCDCAQNLEYTITHVKADYAGFNDKVKGNQRKAYEKFAASLKKQALKANSVDSCYVLLRTFTNYFKDNHLRVQLDWRYRKKYPELAKKLSQQFAKPVVISPSTEKLEWKTNFKILDNKTILLRLPSFEWSEKQIIDSLLSKYKSSLANSAHWIIDLRGNTGGTDYAFSGLILISIVTPSKSNPMNISHPKKTSKY